MTAAADRVTAGPSAASATTSAVSVSRRVRLYPLTFLAEGDEVTVGRPDIDAYYVLPADGAALIQQLADGHTVDEAQRWYEQTYGEAVDIDDFLLTMEELELIAPDDAEFTATDGPVRWQRLGAIVFSGPMLACYAAIVVVTTLLVIRHPPLRPTNHTVFFSHSLLLISLTIVLAQFPLLLLHESFHVLAGRRLGLRTSLHVGRRLYFVVFETRIDGLVGVPRRRRYLPMLAGMLADLLVICACVWIRWATGPSLLGAMALAIGFGTILRLVWQFYFFLGTDLYYVAVTAAGCTDLHGAARATNRNRLDRLLQRPARHDLTAEFTDRDLSVARWYSWLCLIGYAAMVATFALSVVPVTWTFLYRAVQRLAGHHDLPAQLDGGIFVLLLVGQFVVLGLIARRERRIAAHPARTLEAR